MSELPDGAAVMQDTETGEWVAMPDFIHVGGPTLGPFDSREEAVDALNRDPTTEGGGEDE